MKGKKGRIGFQHAINGIRSVVKSEWNFRFHLLATIFVIMVSLYFKLSLFEWVAILIVIGFVLVTEIFNTVTEKIIDYIKPEFHPIAGLIKDVAAGGVLVSAVIAVIVGLIIFLPKFIGLL